MRTRNQKNKNDLQCIQNTDDSVSDTKEWFEKGLDFRDAGDYEAAANAFTKVIDINNNDLKALTQRGIIYSIFLRKPELAINDLTKVIQIDPENAQPFYTLRGIDYKMREEYIRAIEDFNMAINLNPDDALSYSCRGHAYIILGKYYDAIADLDKSIKLNPKSSSYFKHRGTANALLDNKKEAIADYSKAIKLGEKDAFIYYTRGCLYFNSQEYHKAVSDFESAGKLDPKHDYAHYRCGAAYLCRGEQEQALQRFKLAASLGNIDAINYLHSKGIE